MLFIFSHFNGKLNEITIIVICFKINVDGCHNITPPPSFLMKLVKIKVLMPGNNKMECAFRFNILKNQLFLSVGIDHIKMHVIQSETELIHVIQLYFYQNMFHLTIVLH